MTLSLNVVAQIMGYFSGANEVADLKQEFAIRNKVTLNDGVAAGEADIVFADQRLLAASASETLDLAGGLVDAFGAALTFVKVKAILIKAAEDNTNDVVVGPAASNGFLGPFGDASDRTKVKPGGYLMMAAPALAGLGTVTPGTGDILSIANSGAGTSVTYDVVIIGTSA